jgi:acyl-CoA hydrolase
VLPNDTNTLGNLMGGRLLHWMDITAAISAHRHCRRVVVTAAVNNVSFNRAIKLADVVTLEAKVSRAFSTSMEVFIDVYVENHQDGKREKCNEAIYTFVAVDQLGNPINVPELVPESDQEKQRYDGALRRRQLSLILAGKMKPDDATELKALFLKNE